MPTLLHDALRTADDSALRELLVSSSGLPGPRLNLRLVEAFGAAVGVILDRRDTDVGRLETLLDGWAALPEPGDQPTIVLVCAAVAGYGWAAVSRPQWWPDEMTKLARAAADSRWRVREVVATAVQRILADDWDRTAAELTQWAADPNPLIVRAAAAAVAEPALLNGPARHRIATTIQRIAVGTLTAVPGSSRRADPVRTLRQALGFTISVTTAASGDFTLLKDLACSDDPDVLWIVRQNLRKARLRRWPDQLAALDSRVRQ